MIDLNFLKSQGWLSDHQIIEKYGVSNRPLMKKIIKEKGKEFNDDRKLVLKRKNGDNDYIYSPLLISKILNFFVLESYNISESLRRSLKEEECYTAGKLAREFHTAKNSLVDYIGKEGINKTGLVRETEGGDILIHKSLYLRLKNHFLSNQKKNFGINRALCVFAD